VTVYVIQVVRGNPECPDEPWSECSVDCIMSKKIVPRTEPTKVVMNRWIDRWIDMDE
jgi:hypothetical protein